MKWGSLGIKLILGSRSHNPSRTRAFEQPKNNFPSMIDALACWELGLQRQPFLEGDCGTLSIWY